MISVERTPVLSLTPDSISQLGNLDSSSLSELWGGKLLIFHLLKF